MANYKEVKEAMLNLVDTLDKATKTITKFNGLIDEVDETINNFSETLTAVNQQDLIDSIEEAEKELRETFINDLPSTSRTRGILWSLIPFGDKNETLSRVFEINTRENVINARGVGSKSFKEIEKLRVNAGLEYKVLKK